MICNDISGKTARVRVVAITADGYTTFRTSIARRYNDCTATVFCFVKIFIYFLNQFDKLLFDIVSTAIAVKFKVIKMFCTHILYTSFTSNRPIFQGRFVVLLFRYCCVLYECFNIHSVLNYFRFVACDLKITSYA